MDGEILNEAQKKIIALAAKDSFFANFYLTGGTALAAYYLQHRVSDDLDFFSSDELEADFLRAFIEHVKMDLGAAEVRFEKLYDRYIFFLRLEPLDPKEFKVEFARYPFPQLESPQTKKGIRVDSFRDIAANKVMAILDRFDPKDFVDLYFILQQRKLKDAVLDTEKKFGVKIDPLFLGGELMKYRRIAALPKMIKPLDATELKTFFENLVQTLRPKIFK
jgi:predicted nucleotidyltransferase component of viral defense system